MAMKLWATIGVILAFAFSPVLSAEIYGGAYSWDTLLPADRTIFSINTTPEQTFVSLNGTYLFIIPDGTYLVSGATFLEGKKILEDSLEITAKGEGAYRVDLVLFPSENAGLGELIIVEEDAEDFPSFSQIIPSEFPTFPLIFAVVGLALIAGIYLKSASRRKKPPVSAPLAKLKKRQNSRAKSPNEKKTRLPKDPELKAIILEVQKSGGRIVQRDLRRALPYSEAKASLLVSELEARGILRKYKRGRANLLVLSDNSGKSRKGK